MMIIIKNVLTIPDIKILDKDLLKEVPYFNDTIVVDETDKLKKREARIYEIIKQLPADNDKYFVKYKPETDTYNIGKDKEIIFVEDDFDYNAKRRSKKRKIIYTPEELKVIANKRKKIFENPLRNNIEKIKNEVKPKAKANKPKKVEVVEISDEEEPKDYSNILTKIEKIKDIKIFLATLDNDTKNKIIKRLNLDPRNLMRKPKIKSATNIEDLSRIRKKRRESRRLTTEQLVERKMKRKEKQRLKAKQDAVEGLQDFNKFIRDQVAEEGQKRTYHHYVKNIKQEILNSYWKWSKNN